MDGVIGGGAGVGSGDAATVFTVKPLAPQVTANCFPLPRLPLTVSNFPVCEVQVSTLKVLLSAGSNPLTADKFSVPASAAAPLIVILPNWPAAVPPISIATLPPAKLVNPPVIEIVPPTPARTREIAKPDAVQA